MNDEDDDPPLPADDDPAILEALRSGDLRKEEFWVEENDEGCYWPFTRRSPGDPLAVPLADFLSWVLEQLHYSNVEVEEDEEGAVVSLTLGRSAASFDTEEQAVTFVQKRSRDLSAAMAIADARERGVEPEYEGFAQRYSDILRRSGPQTVAGFSTELAHAFQLVDVLRRLQEKSPSLSAPVLIGRAPTEVIGLVGEATRAHLYGLHLAAVALCRAAIEQALAGYVSNDDVRIQETMRRDRGEKPGGPLQNRIDAAKRLGYLESHFADEAHIVRRRANDSLHERDVGAQISENVLVLTRRILEHLFRAPRG